MLTKVPVKTLRYYDEIGLLKPDAINAQNGYRSYKASQLPRLNRILALKDLGLPLERIKRILEQDLSPDELRGMLKLRQAELEEQLQETQQQLGCVAARLEFSALPQHSWTRLSSYPDGEPGDGRAQRATSTKPVRDILTSCAVLG